jgi:3-hydroxyacyl-CoA dehydrogenase
MKIKNVVVIGSGTMGSGIAAHLCNANIPVTLLDLKTEISQNARERIHKSRPPLLIDKTKIDNIKVGNISDDFNVVKDADWRQWLRELILNIKFMIKFLKAGKMEQ